MLIFQIASQIILSLKILDITQRLLYIIPKVCDNLVIIFLGGHAITIIAMTCFRETEWHA